MDVSVEIHCDKCGSANLSFPPGDDDPAPIACNDCGEAQGTVAELRDALMACAREHSAEALRSRLGNGAA